MKREDEIKQISEFHPLKVIKVEVDSEPNKKGDLWYLYILKMVGFIAARAKYLFDWKIKQEIL